MLLRRTTRFNLLLTTAVIVFTLSFEAPVMQGGNGKGKGGGGSDSPREVPATATFFDVTSGIQGDSDGAAYVDGELDGGWAHLVANGNFTLRTYGSSKKKNSDPRKLAVTLSPPFTTTLIGPAFLAVNDSLCPSGSCPSNDFDLMREGGLRDMAPGEQIFVQITGRMADPGNSSYTILWRCGPQPRADGSVDYAGTEFFEAMCTDPLTGPGPCIQWQVASPSPRLCAVFVEDDRGNQSSLGPAQVEINLLIDRQ